MAPSNKFLLPTCAPAHGDIATYFFFEKIFRSDTRMRVTIASFLGVFCPHLNFGGQKRPNPNPPTKYCGSAAVVRCGGRVGDIWGAAPRFGPRSSSRTAIPSCFCPELGGHRRRRTPVEPVRLLRRPIDIKRMGRRQNLGQAILPDRLRTIRRRP